MTTGHPDSEPRESSLSPVDRTILELLAKRDKGEIVIGGINNFPITDFNALGRFDIFIAPPVPMYDLEALNRFAEGLITTIEPQIDPTREYDSYIVVGSLSVDVAVGERTVTKTSVIKPISEELREQIDIHPDSSGGSEKETLRRKVNVFVYPHRTLAELAAEPRGHTNLNEGMIRKSSIKKIQENEKRNKPFPHAEFPLREGGK